MLLVLLSRGGANFECCVYKPQPTNPTHSALKVATSYLLPSSNVCVCFTYSNNIEGVVTHFSDLGILVMHQIYEVGWSLYREG